VSSLSRSPRSLARVRPVEKKTKRQGVGFERRDAAAAATNETRLRTMTMTMTIDRTHGETTGDRGESALVAKGR